MRKMLLFFSSALGLATTTLAPDPGRAAMPTLTTLVSFYGGNGAGPGAGLIADARGNLFGTTVLGGAHDKGTVFKILKTKHGYDTSPIVLVDFDGSNGFEPSAGLLADAKGNLFGTTVFGGAGNAVVLGLALLAGHALGQQMSLKEQLMGPWTVVSVTREQGGNKTEPFGPNPQGLFMFDLSQFQDFATERGAACRSPALTQRRMRRVRWS